MTASTTIPPQRLPEAEESAHWRAIAQRWPHVAAPLRPSPSDLAVYTRLMHQAAAAARARRQPFTALILGVTPELQQLSWPSGTRIHAIDRNQTMIDLVWPGRREDVQCLDWRALPANLQPIDLALGDGVLHLLSCPQSQSQFRDALAASLPPGGLFVLRLFEPPPEPDSPADVLRDLHAGLIPNVDTLKLRWLIAQQGARSSGVRLHEAWTALHAAEPALNDRAAALGWPPSSIATLSTYQGCTATYLFVTRAQAIHLFESHAQFRAVSVHSSVNAPRSVHCPIIAFERQTSH